MIDRLSLNRKNADHKTRALKKKKEIKFTNNSVHISLQENSLSLHFLRLKPQCHYEPMAYQDSLQEQLGPRANHGQIAFSPQQCSVFDQKQDQ